MLDFFSLFSIIRFRLSTACQVTGLILWVFVALKSAVVYADTMADMVAETERPIETVPTVASINLCADQLVLLLAEPQQILTLSTLSHEKAGSYLFEQARNFPVTTGDSEQVLKFEPKLVIAGEYTTPHTLKLLRELGVRVETIPIANTLTQLYTNISNVALWLGRETQGAELIANMRATVDEIARRQQHYEGAMPTAAYYDPNGYTVGNDTLRGQVLQLSGWKNVATAGGINNYGSLSLESLVQLAPDALIDSPYSADTYSRGQQMLKHPALLASGLDPIIITIPSRQTICAGPWTVDMIEQLSVERAKFLSALEAASK